MEPRGKEGWTSIFVTRAVVALVQAMALFLLTNPGLRAGWWLEHPEARVPLMLLAAFAPLIPLFALGQIATRPLLAWTLAASLILGGLGWCAGWRVSTEGAPGAVDWFPLILQIAAALFIAHVLVVTAVMERRRAPSYEGLFEGAWKLAVQLVLVLVFVGVFWGVFALGAALFDVLKLGGFGRVIWTIWFILPATALAVALAIHVTDVQPSLIRGARSLALGLFSVLLPLLVVILLGFLLALPFTGLTPLWRTKAAAAIMLSAAVLLILFINACFQDGAAEHRRSRIERLAALIGAVELPFVVGLAAWAMVLRVEQYGLTGERVLALAVTAIASCYALGYLWAAVASREWLGRVRGANLVTAYLIIAAILGLLTPLADPARLMVASQMARLASGAVSATAFDYAVLAKEGGRWGHAALVALRDAAAGPDAETRRREATLALANHPGTATPEPIDLAKRFRVFPEGRVLPVGLVDVAKQTIADERYVSCLTATEAPCVARYVTIRPGGPEALLVLDVHNALILERTTTGVWRLAATLQAGTRCAALRDAVTAGALSTRAADWPDLVLGDKRLPVTPIPDSATAACP